MTGRAWFALVLLVVVPLLWSYRWITDDELHDRKTDAAYSAARSASSVHRHVEGEK